MKNSKLFNVALMLLLGIQLSFAQKQAWVEHVSTPPVIDGVAEELWDSIAFTEMENFEKGNPDTNDLSARFKALWTSSDTVVYVLIEVDDDTTFLTDKWSSGDFVQVAVDLDNDKMDQYLFDDMFWMIRPEWNDSALVGRYGPNWGDLPVIDWHSTRNDTAYYIELALPLMSLGKSDFYGNRTSIGFDIKVTDGEIVGSDTLWKAAELVWSAGAAWNDPSKMGTLVLREGPETPAPKISKVQYTETAPTIDGVVDEIWDTAYVVNLKNFETGYPSVDDLSAQFSTLWTAEDTTLYVLIEVEDDQTFLTDSWSKGDFVQVNIDLDNDKTEQYMFDDMFWMIRPSWNDSALVGRYGPNWGDLPQINWHSEMTGTSYVIEMELPLADLGILSFDGNRTPIGFDIKITDGEIVNSDTLWKDSELVWSNGKSWNDPSHMNTLILAGAPIADAVTDVNYTETAPIIDGEKDEVWDNANFSAIERVEKGMPSVDDLKASFSTLWTAQDTTLYVLIEVTDDMTFLTNAWSQGDFVQVSVDLDNDKNDQYLFDDMFWMIRPSWNDSALVGRYGPNWGDLPVIDWSSSLIGTSYTIELALPLSHLGISKYTGTGTEIGFDIKVTDGEIIGSDTLAKDAEMVWNAGASWNTPSEMGTLVLTGYTSVDDVRLQQNFTLYPNPASDIINVRSAEQFRKLRIFDSKGTLIRTIDVRDSNLGIDISTYTTGIYFIQLESKKGEYTYEKFIKR